MMSHDPIVAAESVLNARAAELHAAREALSRAETATHTAAENVTRARALSDAAAADLEAATLAADAAEKTWTADQTPSLWTKLSNARGSRDQAEVRARSLRGSAESAAADHAAALARVASARADLEAAEARHQHAVAVLDGLRADRAAVDEAAAAAEGRRLARVNAAKAAREALGPPFERDVAPALARFVSAVVVVNDALSDLVRVVDHHNARRAAVREECRALGVRDAGTADLATVPALALGGATVRAWLGARFDPQAYALRVLDAPRPAGVAVSAVEQETINAALALLKR